MSDGLITSIKMCVEQRRIDSTQNFELTINISFSFLFCYYFTYLILFYLLNFTLFYFILFTLFCT